MGCERTMRRAALRDTRWLQTLLFLAALLRASSQEAEEQLVTYAPSFSKEDLERYEQEYQVDTWIRGGGETPTEVFLRDPSAVDVPPGCEFYVPFCCGIEDAVYSGNGHFYEYYHFLIDFVPRLHEALQNSNCPRGSQARVWVTGYDNKEHFHLSQFLFCPTCSRSAFKNNGTEFKAWTMKDAMKINLFGNSKSMQPQFDILFKDWGPPVMADKYYDYGRNLTTPPDSEMVRLPYRNITGWPNPDRHQMKTQMQQTEEWSNQPTARFEALRDLGWKVAGIKAPVKRRYALLIRRKDRMGAARRSLDSDFDEKAKAAFAKHGVRLRIVSLTAFSMVQQIRLFAGAGLIMGIHGAGLSNMVWSQRGTGVFELDGYMFPCYENLAKRMHMRKVIPYGQKDESGKRITKFSISFDEVLEGALERFLDDDLQSVSPVMAGARIGGAASTQGEGNRKNETAVKHRRKDHAGRVGKGHGGKG